MPVYSQKRRPQFEQLILPHLDSAYNLARWLTRSDQDAEDVVQESYLRAFQFFSGYRGGDSRAWLLRIVRNTAHTWLRRHRSPEFVLPLDEDLHGIPDDALSPEALLLQSADRQWLRQAIAELPVEFREVVVLRDLEELSYKEIADIVDIPLGTVMSRLARARKRLQHGLVHRMNEETHYEL